MRSGVVICAVAVSWMAAVPAPTRADQWKVEKAGLNLYRISGRDAFIRTEGCEDAPASGSVEVQRVREARRLTFTPSGASCTIRDVLAPVGLQTAFSSGYLQLTLDGNDWYRVQDSDLYFKTSGCISRSISQTVELHVNRDGSGWLRFGGHPCVIERAFRRLSQ